MLIDNIVIGEKGLVVLLAFGEGVLEFSTSDYFNKDAIAE